MWGQGWGEGPGLGGVGLGLGLRLGLGTLKGGHMWLDACVCVCGLCRHSCCLAAAGGQPPTHGGPAQVWVQGRSCFIHHHCCSLCFPTAANSSNHRITLCWSRPQCCLLFCAHALAPCPCTAVFLTLHGSVCCSSLLAPALQSPSYKYTLFRKMDGAATDFRAGFQLSEYYKWVRGVDDNSLVVIVTTTLS